MRTKKSRKSLSMFVVLFALVFMVGAAFAFTAGALTIGGQATIEPVTDYVIWSSATGTMAPTYAGTTTQPITDARGRTDQHITWTVEFESAGTATLAVEAHNESTTTAATLAVVTGFYVDGAPAPTTAMAEWGLTFDASGVNALAGALAADARRTGEVTLTWAGTAPSATSPVFEFTFELSYIPV